MASIYDSDTVPSERDIDVARQIFTSDSGEFDVEKMAHEVSRQRRKELLQSSSTKEILQCLRGDDLGQNKGLIEDMRLQKEMTSEIHNVVMKSATTKKIAKQDPFIDKLKGGLFLLMFFVTTTVAILAIVLK